MYETIIYCEEVADAVAFYRDELGLALVDELDDLGAAFRLHSGAMLLIFDPRKSSVAGRPAPSHGAVGAGHVAFRIDRSQIASWRARFRELGIEIEHDSTSDNGAQQLYVRDPAGNSVELVAGELWPLA